MVNRAAVAEVLGFEHEEALTLGWAVAGLNAYSKGVSLGLFQPTPKEVKERAEKPTPCMRNLGRRFLLAKKGRGPPAS